MKELEVLYEQILEEGKITDWIKNHKDIVQDAFLGWLEKHGGLKQVIGGGIGAFTVAASPVVMAAYFHKFFQENPETVDYPIRFLKALSHYLAQYLIDHPEVLEVVKKIAGHSS